MPRVEPFWHLSVECKHLPFIFVSYDMFFWIMRRWYQMKISAMWEEGGNKTPASPARVVQYEGVHLYGH
jgi:hypothetical protein